MLCYKYTLYVVTYDLLYMDLGPYVYTFHIYNTLYKYTAMCKYAFTVYISTYMISPLKI